MQKAKHKRLTLLVIGFVSVAIGITLILSQFKENLVFFYSPTDFVKEQVYDREIRVGGLVAKDSIVRQADGVTLFVLTDLDHTITVRYQGLLPALFREEQGMVAKGYARKEQGKDVFVASELLAKHDERYMPKEVADALKKSGKWRP